MAGLDAGPSPADFHARGLAAWERRDYAGALGSWSEGVTLRPDDALLQYRPARAGLADLRTPGPASQGRAATVPLEAVRGVWIATAVLNGEWRGRFLVDTGSSVTIVAPALAASVGLLRSVGAGVELQTVAGLTSGPAARLASLRVGEVELLDRYHLILDGHRRLLHLRPSLPH